MKENKVIDFLTTDGLSNSLTYGDIKKFIETNNIEMPNDNLSFNEKIIVLLIYAIKDLNEKLDESNKRIRYLDMSNARLF